MMIDSLIDIDKRIFLVLNELHAPWLDPIMYWVSDTWIWVPLYGVLLYQIFKLPRRQAIIAVFCIAAAIIVSDQMSSKVIRSRVERPRPTWDQQISAQVHTVNEYRGGHYGFPSSHAANTFCAAVLIVLLLKKSWTRWLLVWALLVSYSRIYLGVHYPGDIFFGALLGSVFAGLSYWVYKLGIRS